MRVHLQILRLVLRVGLVIALGDTGWASDCGQPSASRFKEALSLSNRAAESIVARIEKPPAGMIEFLKAEEAKAIEEKRADLLEQIRHQRLYNPAQIIGSLRDIQLDLSQANYANTVQRPGEMFFVELTLLHAIESYGDLFFELRSYEIAEATQLKPHFSSLDGIMTLGIARLDQRNLVRLLECYVEDQWRAAGSSGKDVPRR